MRPKGWIHALAICGVLTWGITCALAGEEPAHAQKDGDGARLLREKLQRPVTFHFRAVPLEDVLDAVRSADTRSDDYGIPIDVNTDGLRQVGVSLRTPVTVDVEGLPLKQALSRILEPLGLTFEVCGERLLVFARACRGRLTLLDRQPQDKRIWAQLETRVDLNFENVPLENVLKSIGTRIEKSRGRTLPMYVDPVGLAEAEVTLQTRVSIREEGKPLKEALTKLLKPLGLQYQVKDGLVTITSPEPDDDLPGEKARQGVAKPVKE